MLRKRGSVSSIRTTDLGQSQSGRRVHQFTACTFAKPTYCDLCSQFIWGFVNQGEQCSGCGYMVHHRCQYLVRKPCSTSASSVRSLSRSSLFNYDSPPPSPLPTKHGLVTELFAATQAESRKLESLAHQPNLNLATLLKNNNNHLARQAPFIWLNETVAKLITWHSPPATMLFLACFIIVCITN